MRFASSISLEWAAALVLCDSVLDSELDSELDWVSEFVVFALELDWDPDVSESWLSGIDAALAMSVVCVLCIGRTTDFSQHWFKTCILILYEKSLFTLSMGPVLHQNTTYQFPSNFQPSRYSKRLVVQDYAPSYLQPCDQCPAVV